MAKKKSKSSKNTYKKTKKKVVKKKSAKKKVKKSVKKKATKKVSKKIVKKSKKTVVKKTVSKKSKTEKKYVFKRRPLSASFMIVGLFGLIVTSVYTVSARIPLTWGFMFIVLFLIMFIASLVSLEPNKREI